MTRYYAVPDLHGRYDILEKCLEEINKRTKDDDKIIFLGDYIDRGPDSSKVIQHLIDLQKENKNVICLMGNHEQIMHETLSRDFSTDFWYSNGGRATIQSYNGVVNKEHLEWIDTLPLYYETPKHVFVHAGVAPDIPLKQQNPDVLMWSVYPHDHPGWPGKHVVHGHEIHWDGPHEWEYRSALDTGSFHSGRHVIGVFDDTQGKAVEFIEVRIP